MTERFVSGNIGVASGKGGEHASHRLHPYHVSKIHTKGYGGPGNDTIKGGDGFDDKLYGGPGGSIMYGGPGKNTYTGGGIDHIQANVDQANGGAKEVIYAGAGDDGILTADGLPDQIQCGGGNNDQVEADFGDSVSDDCEIVGS